MSDHRSGTQKTLQKRYDPGHKLAPRDGRRRGRDIEEDESQMHHQDTRSLAYALYLESPEWQAKRQAVLDRDEHRCTECGTTKYLHVHHLTYARIFHEELEDLVTLRDGHHAARHGRKSAREQRAETIERLRAMEPPTEEERLRWAEEHRQQQAERRQKQVEQWRKNRERNEILHAQWEAEQAAEEAEDHKAMLRMLAIIRQETE